MVLLCVLLFVSGLTVYVLAAVLAVSYLAGANARALTLAHRLAAVGGLLVAALFIARWAAWGRLPLTTTVDVLGLFLLMTMGSALFVLRDVKVRALWGFYLPPMALIYVVNTLWGWQYLYSAPKQFRALFLATHVGLAFWAYALFFLASLTSMAYVHQARRLKHHRRDDMSYRLPPLELLDGLLYRLVLYGYPLFVVTLLLGLTWAWLDRTLLGPHWWMSPKVVSSYVMVAFYALVVHLRFFGRLRGPKLAHLIFYVFAVFLAAYIVLVALDLRNYNFWGANP